MAVIVKNIIPRKQAEGAQTTQYTAPALTRCIVDKFTVTNTTATARTFSVNLVPNGGAADAGNCVLSVRTISPGETHACPEVVGQVLEAGGFISTLASAAAALTISASGREIS